MKKAVLGIAAIVAIVATAAVFVPADNAVAQAPGFLTLEGAGSAIGVTVREATDEDAKAAKVDPPGGVIIESVRSGSPAEKAGFRTGDLVLEFDGERIRSVRHFTRLVRESRPRRSVRAVVVRGTSRQTLDVVPEVTGDFRTDALDALRDGRRSGRELLRRFDLRSDLPRNFDLNVRPQLRGRGSLGVTVTPLTSQLAEYFGVKEGALITAVQSGGPGADAGLRAGDVITAIGGRNVSTAADVSREVRRAQAGDGIDITVMRDRKSLTLKATLPSARPVVPSGRGGLPV
jgi:serine protease Do